MQIIDIKLIENLSTAVAGTDDWRTFLDEHEVKYLELEARLTDGSGYTRPVVMIDGEDYSRVMAIEVGSGNLLWFLKARPGLKGAVQMDIVHSGGPGGQLTKVHSLVFQHDPAHEKPWCLHYDVSCDGADGTWGGIVDCAEEDHAAGEACGLTAEAQGFGGPEATATEIAAVYDDSQVK